MATVVRPVDVQDLEVMASNPLPAEPTVPDPPTMPRSVDLQLADGTVRRFATKTSLTALPTVTADRLHLNQFLVQSVPDGFILGHDHCRTGGIDAVQMPYLNGFHAATEHIAVLDDSKLALGGVTDRGIADFVADFRPEHSELLRSEVAAVGIPATAAGMASSFGAIAAEYSRSARTILNASATRIVDTLPYLGPNEREIMGSSLPTAETVASAALNTVLGQIADIGWDIDFGQATRWSTETATIAATIHGSALGVAGNVLSAEGMDILDRNWMPRYDAEGSYSGDLDLMEDVSASSTKRVAALDRIVDRIIWVPRKRAVRTALRERAIEEERSIRAVQRDELAAAVYLVLARKGEPAFLRQERQWLVQLRPDELWVDWGTGGQRVMFAPWDLPVDDFARWFEREVVKAAERAVLGQPYPPTADALDAGAVSAADSLPGADPAVDPLLALLAREQQDERERQLQAVLNQAPPRARQLLDLIARGATEAEAARRLGMAPATARVHLHRLRKKLV